VRPGFFDIAAVQETVRTARERNTPYVVVINAAPVKREQKEAPAINARLDELLPWDWAAAPDHLQRAA
jgi:hypothetical protein